MFKTGSPLLREIVEEETRKAARKARRGMAESAVTTVLAARFGPEAGEVKADLKAISDEGLKELLRRASTCPDLASFREQIPSRKSKRKERKP